jgi:hypothetical protein
MRPLFVIPFILLLTSGIARAAHPPVDPALVLRGKVVDGTGTPVPRARFVLEAKRRTNTNADEKGAFALMLPLPSPERLRAAPCSVRVFATAKGMRLVLPNGDPALKVVLRIERGDSSDLVVARSNDERLAAMAAMAVASRRPLAELDGLRMLGLQGERVGDPPDPLMPHVAKIAVMPAPVAVAPPEKEKKKAAEPKKTVAKPDTASKTVAVNTTQAAAKPPATKTKDKPKTTTSPKPPAQPAKTSTSGKVTASTSTKTIKEPVSPIPGTPVVVTEIPGAPPPEPPPPAGDCSCRFKGTVEIVSDPPPTAPVGIVVWVDGAPGIRDSIELALGSPRPFELLGIPCGAVQLRIQVSSERNYVVRSPATLENLTCTKGGLIQPRIVLIPRRGL